jgi:hypothetical protein
MIDLTIFFICLTTWAISGIAFGTAMSGVPGIAQITAAYFGAFIFSVGSAITFLLLRLRQ